MTCNPQPSSSAIARLALVRTLKRLTPVEFDELVFALNPPAGIVPPKTAPQGHRTTALCQWVEGPTGPTLLQLQAVLDLVLNSASHPTQPSPSQDEQPPVGQKLAAQLSIATTLELTDLQQQLTLLQKQHQACADEARLTGDPDRKITLEEKVKRLLQQIIDIEQRIQSLQTGCEL